MLLNRTYVCVYHACVGEKEHGGGRGGVCEVVIFAMEEKVGWNEGENGESRKEKETKEEEEKNARAHTHTLQRHQVCIRALVALNPVPHPVVKMLTLFTCLTSGGSEGDGADLEDDGEELQGFVFSKLK